LTITKLVTGNGTGDYNCDGSDDQESINKALSWAYKNPGNMVYLVGPFDFTISDQVLIGSDTTFAGDASAVLKVGNMACGTNVNNCVFPNGTAVLASYPKVIPKNIEIYGFTFDGNCQNQSTKLGYAHDKLQSAGSGVERLIQLQGEVNGRKASNIKIHNMIFRDAFGEAAHIKFAENVEIYDNDAENHQHDAFFCIEVNGVNVLKNNRVKGITDSCARLDNCTNWKVYGNKFLSYTGDHNNTAMKMGHNGFQVANEANKTTLTNNIEIFNNEFKGPNLCGIWINDQRKKAGLNPQTVRIHNNTFTNEIAWSDWSVWSVGINVGPWGNGVTIDHNTFDGCYDNSIQFNNAIVKGCTANVFHNNIINTKGTRTRSAGGPPVVGYGIANLVPESMTVIAEDNYMSGNKIGNYYKVTPKSIANSLLLDATIIGDEDDDTSNYKVLIKCLESETNGFTDKLSQDYNIYKKV